MREGVGGVVVLVLVDGINKREVGGGESRTVEQKCGS